MNFWSDFKVKTKCLILVIASVASLLVIITASLYHMRGMADDEKDLSIAVKHVGMLNDIKSDMITIRLDIMKMLAHPEDTKPYEDDFRKREQRIKETVAAFSKYDLDSREKELAAQFEQGYEAYRVQAEQLAGLVTSPDRAGRRAAITAGEKQTALRAAVPIKAINDLVSYNVADAKSTYEKDVKSYQLSTVLMITLAAIAAAFMMILGLLIASSISSPLRKVLDTLALVASGDLTARSAVKSGDEMGMLSAKVNDMAEHLMETINRVSQSSVKVASAANQLQSTSRQIADGAEDVAGQTCTVATASEEMAATTADIASNCHVAAGGGKEATERAKTGTKIVEETVNVMGRIASQVQASSATVAGLGARGDQIGEIVGTIEDIADQTNLLALNAAIEAARAGEQGRGFAVVAAEVRALAERTTRATKEISDMIKSIQQVTKEAVEAMQGSVMEVENGTREAAKSGESLQVILDQISHVTTQVDQIATAAEEQTATTCSIASNIGRITEVVQVTSQGAHDSASAASHLAGIADELQRLVARFRVA
jgi:methyl-accepting chemotaxis protein